MDSSLSSVPPVWPSPRPAACGTAPPHAITTGTSGMVILSPTPPVECLSTNASGLPSRRRSVKSIRSPEATIAAVQRAISATRHAAQEDRHQQRRHLLVGHPPVGVGVDHPVDRRIGQHTAVALGPDDRRRIERERLASRGSTCASPVPALRLRRQVVGTERVGQQLAQRPRPQRMVDQQLAGRRAPAAPACTARTASAPRPRRPHTTARSACRRRRNAGRRPLHTRHRDLGHMRHSPHCSRPPSGGRRPAQPPRPGIPSTARRRVRRPQLPCAATFSSQFRMSCQPSPADSECIPKLPFRGVAIVRR